MKTKKNGKKIKNNNIVTHLLLEKKSVGGKKWLDNLANIRNNYVPKAKKTENFRDKKSSTSHPSPSKNFQTLEFPYRKGW